VALSLAHRVYLMGKAHVGYTGTAEELKNNNEARAKYLEV
jgi:branched-chain amino acid transport system ATP-binding protein